MIQETHRRLVETLSSIPEINFDLLYVDGGSRDTTLIVLREIQQSDRRVWVIALSRNFGHQVAVTAGLEHAGGDAVVVIDADLQDPPDVILEMLDRWRQGVDVAYGVRSEREGETTFKLWTAKAFYRLQGLDIEALGHAFAELSIPFLALALTFLAAGYTIRIGRWWWMLRTFEPSLPFKACVWPFLTSIAVINVMPFRVGDALRVFGFRRQLSSPVVRVLGTLVIERVLDLVALLGFFFLGLLGLPSGDFQERFVVGATWLAGLSIATILVVILLTPCFGRIIQRIAAHSIFTSRNLSEAVVNHGEHFVGALGVVRSPSRLLVLLGLSVLTWAFEGAVFAIVAATLHATTSPLGPSLGDWHVGHAHSKLARLCGHL